MSNVLDPQRVMEALEDGVTEEVKSFFPIEGKKHTLVARKVYVGTPVHIDDIGSQMRARLRGRTWSQPIHADVDLVDNESGSVIDSVKKMKILALPKITKRHSYIIDGKEYQVDNQWRLKSGVYSRRKANGELEAQWNLAKGRGFRLGFDPEKRRFLMSYGTTNVQLLPVLQALGVPDEEIRAAFGDEVYTQGATKKRRGELIKLAKALGVGRDVNSDADAIPVIQQVLSETEILPETTKVTLGQAFSSVNWRSEERV